MLDVIFTVMLHMPGVELKGLYTLRASINQLFVK